MGNNSHRKVNVGGASFAKWSEGKKWTPFKVWIKTHLTPKEKRSYEKQLPLQM